MRNLTIKRKRKIVASVMKVFVFIDDQNKEVLDIEKSKIKQLPKLKNGQTISIEIPDESVTLYIIFDRHFPQKFHAKYQISAGERDVEVHTYPKYDPLSGNPFTIVENTNI